MKRQTYTAESVTQGHPDKLCDLIADAILDECLMTDENARVACEVIATAHRPSADAVSRYQPTKGKIIIAGEIACMDPPDCERIALQTVSAVGYDTSGLEVEVLVTSQSPDISQCVDGDNADEQGAGDQGVMYGYATNETKEMLPMPCVLAHRITRLLTISRVDNIITGLMPDGKSQVSVEYVDDRPERVAAIVISAQHTEDKDVDELRMEIRDVLIPSAFYDFPIDEDTKIIINPSGRFVLGGIDADTGLTGRKLMVDSYGGFIPHGGGAFSGKDASKVDRSGAYMARYIAKNIVAAGLAERCLVSFAYAIGVAKPVAISIDTYGTGLYEDDEILDAVKKVFDCRPAVICNELALYLPIFTDTTNYGHFGKKDLPWEQTDRTHELLFAIGVNQ